MHHAYILLGTNLGDRLLYLQQATTYITQQIGEVWAASSIYKTAAWGFTEQPSFYNQVLVVKTDVAPENLMQQLLDIETQLGRIRSIKFGPRTIDIDILLIDNLVNQSAILQLPHPALPQRKFALMPLAEVAPNLFHPVEKKTISQLLQVCTDTLNVQKITPTAS
ncbi:MAG: 2-amino-4-hydroxy-6-hydroxymethyldihydropteridine diphosphokinase [Flavobacterium sp.]|nr:2-amino-4-hydroxy-6-hydroxymethyldihydropteridine diphosphokinase [Flavobacterium sp.]